MSDKQRVIPKEMAFVIPYDADAGMFFLQQKDCTYWRESFRWHYNFFGTGLIREEKPATALKRKLIKEMPNVAEKIAREMKFWKEFRLPWGGYAEGEYAAHVYVMMTASKYEMIDLVDDAGRAGTKRGSLAYISTDRIDQMITHQDFMGSLHIVAEEFIKETKTDPVLFWNKLQKT